MEDRERYKRQNELVNEVVNAYEQQPEVDSERIAELMQEMQACGPPPSELSAPGLPGPDACTIS